MGGWGIFLVIESIFMLFVESSCIASIEVVAFTKYISLILFATKARAGVT